MKRFFIFCITLCVVFQTEAQNYISEDVTCYSDSISLCGSLTYPEGAGPFPTIIIVSGTGKQDRDGRFAAHRPFFEISDYLTQRGFAVLRMDDRGVGESSGVYEEATTLDFANDVLAEIKFLKNKSIVDTTKIGLIGHSEGGAVAFIVASSSPDISFVISLAGLAVDGFESLVLQNRAILESDKNLTKDLVEDYMQLYIALFRTVKETPLDNDIELPLQKAFEQWRKRQPEEKLKALDMVNGHDQMFINSYIRAAQTRWYRQMIKYNPAEYISKIKVPLLALNGEKDIMVTPDENLAAIATFLDEAGNKSYKTIKLEGLNHMFQHCNECTMAEIPSLPEAISPEVLKIMGDWLKELYP